MTGSPFNLPAWAKVTLRQQKMPLVSRMDRMRFVIGLANENVERGTGGPFGAAVFEAKTGVLVSIGVNIVTIANCSHSHAEMAALANAQKELENFDLGGYALDVGISGRGSRRAPIDDIAINRLPNTNNFRIKNRSTSFA